MAPYTARILKYRMKKITVKFRKTPIRRCFSIVSQSLESTSDVFLLLLNLAKLNKP